MNRCCICIHNHKQYITQIEHLSLLRIFDFCTKNNLINDLFFVIPQSLDLNLFVSTYLVDFANDNNIELIYRYVKYSDECFSSLNAYNNMLSLSANHYGDFGGNYDYMLTYQLDGYIFDNDLNYFLDKNYDYIGGYYLPMYTERTKYNHYDNIDTEHHIIMNSGVSLKNIKFCINSINEHYRKYLDGCEFNNVYSYINDDSFFSLFYNKEVNPIDSIKFSLNWAGAESHYAINNFKYPFCCHGINRSKFLMKLVENYNKENDLNYSNYI